MNLKLKPYDFRIIAEYALLFIILPGILSLLKPRAWIYPILWVLAVICYKILKKHYSYNFHADWNYKELNRNNIRKILVRFSFCAGALLVFTGIAIPDHLFSLPLERPLIWVLVMILYPLLSVVPQEILFRSFFFRKYSNYASGSGKLLIFMSALAFGWVHIVLRNWVAVLFSFAGGLIFSSTYNKTRSLALVCFEHALYGCYIFTIGLGFYFFHGNAVK